MTCLGRFTFDQKLTFVILKKEKSINHAFSELSLFICKCNPINFLKTQILSQMQGKMIALIQKNN